jgi:hypothetical protein
MQRTLAASVVPYRKFKEQGVRAFSGMFPRRSIAAAKSVHRLTALPACPRIVLDFHGVADLFEPSELLAMLGGDAGRALIVSYVKPLGEIRVHAQQQLQHYCAVGFDAWLSFVKPPISEPLLVGTKGHFMATVGSELLIDDHSEHIASATARHCSGMRVQCRADVEAALSLAQAGPAAWAGYRPMASEARPTEATAAKGRKEVASAGGAGTSSSPSVRCPDWNAGHCVLGAACELRHGTRATACKFGAAHCRRGDACEFRHAS